jgi:cytoskeleton protein RodZ
MLPISVGLLMSEPDVQSSPIAADGEQQETSAVPMSTGAQLAALREARGWAVEQVASQLNLAVRQIHALEADDYAALPGMPIARGFIRAYAKMLRVDAAPLLAAIPSDTQAVREPAGNGKPLAAPFSESRLPSMVDRRGVPAKRLAGWLLVGVLAAAALAVQQAGGLQALTESLSLQPGKGGLDDAGVADAAKPQEASAEPVSAESVPESASDAVAAQPAATAEAVPAQAPAAEPAPPSQPVAEQAVGGKDALVMKLKEDSWIEIRRSSDGRIVSSGLFRAGATETIDISEPVSIVVGNAAGVDMLLRGEPVKLNPHAGGNVARLSLK